MPKPVERLDRAFADVEAATGADFFRRLRDYNRLLDSDDAIGAALRHIDEEVESAQARLDAGDRAVISDLVRFRRELAQRAPETDDSGQPRPPGSLLDIEMRRNLDSWMWTLANFDAIAADEGDGIVRRYRLDGTRARMLGEILHVKIYDLQHPSGQRRSQRQDLDDLAHGVSAARARHDSAQRDLEEVTQTSGFLSHRRVQLVASYLEPSELRPVESEEEKRERAEAVLLEVSGEFHHLREAVRPEEARGQLGLDAQRAVDRHEQECRADLVDLQRSLRPKLEEVGRETAPRFWHALDASQKIQVVGIAAASVIGVAAIVVTLILAT